MPKPAGGFVCGSISGEIFVIGGTNWEGGTKQWLSDIHIFSPEKRAWRTDVHRTLIAYAVSGLIDEGGFIAIVGGTTGVAPSDKMLIVGSGRAVVRHDKLGTPAVLASGGLIGQEFFVIGGTDDPANLAGLKRQALAMNLRSGTVEKLPDFPGKPFGIAASAVAKNDLFIFGGASWTGEAQLVDNTAEAYAFSSGSKQWRKIRSFPYAVRGLTAVPLDHNRLYLGGGYTTDAEGFTDKAFIYDIAKDTYTAAKPLPYKAMVALVRGGAFIYCLGGEDKPKSRTDACYRISIDGL